MSDSDTNSVIEPTPSRREYTQGASYQDVLEANAVPIFDRDDPIALFAEWMADARTSEPNDSNAMALSTVDAGGMPDVRMVLLKGIDARGFTFYSHNSSAKGQQISGNGKAALCFHWKSLRRQVRVRGEVVQIEASEADTYFASRARESQLGAWASDQSQPLNNREQFEADLKAAADRFDGRNIPRPPNWHGYRVQPAAIEFWRDRPFRLHDRLVFLRSALDEPWTKGRLYP